MSTTTTTTPEPSAPDFDYETTQRTIIDRAEFARLIREHGNVRVLVFVHDYLRDELVKGFADECFIVDIPQKQALEQLARGSYDSHVWEFDSYGELSISFHLAPAWLQMARRREILLRKIAREERFVASCNAALDPEWHRRCAAELASVRMKLQELDGLIAARRHLAAMRPGELIAIDDVQPDLQLATA